jgi:2-C-methyl-D-erythritol 4-phosphate cytidylyltransferase
MANAAILLTAGKGSRMQDAVKDKTLHLLKGKPAVNYSLEAFIESNIIDHYSIVYRNEEQLIKLQEAIKPISKNLHIDWIQGGPERQDSVFNALTRLPSDIDYVFIHDCARPLVVSSTLPQLLALAQDDKAATLAHHLTDTIKQADKGNESTRNCHLKHINRDNLWAMETPQVFSRELIQSSYQKIVTNKITITDDTSAVIECGHLVSILLSPSPNPKMTTPEDISYIEYLLEKR